MDFDTGSSDLFLPSISCGSSCDGHARYDPSASKTSVDLNKTFDLMYGSGDSVSGEQYNDTASIAGLTVPYRIFFPVVAFRFSLMTPLRHITKLLVLLPRTLLRSTRTTSLQTA